MPRSPDLLRAVGRRIGELRRLRGLTQEALAARLGIGAKNLQRVEAGQNLTLRTLGLVAETLDVPPHELLRAVGATVPGLGGDTLGALRAAGVEVVTGAARPGARYVPVLALEDAAGHLREPASGEVLAWCVLPGPGRRPPPRTFVARVLGDSMQPRIPRGAWCVFGPVGPGRLVDRVLLVEHRALVDPDTGGAFGVKKVAAVEATRAGRRRVTLAALNGRYKPSVIEVASDAELRAMAELVGVLAAG
jgi:transcriptional regulator with XRE-family HTH domain